MMKNLYLPILTIILCSCASVKEEATNIPRLNENGEADEKLSSFVVVADPQIHNIYGSSLKQMFGVSDIASKVAVRPPELNILARYSLERLIENSLEVGNEANVTLVLGDATNVGCSGEYETFYKTITKATPNTVWLKAHGNHDSYLMGTTNGYTLHDDVASTLPNSVWPPKVISNGLPSDISWWNLSDRPTGKMNWRDACLQGSRSTPMNKIRWMAKYIDHLNNYDVDIDSKLISKDSKFNEYNLKSEPNSSIAGRPFILIGKWYEPTFIKENGKVRLPSESFLLKPYGSYLVQAYSLDNNTITVLLDSSVCIEARAGKYFYSENAGTHACIGDDQLNDIKEIIQNSEFSGKDFIFAGHGTLDELDTSERKKLIALFESSVSSNNKWTYISAHTHYPINDRIYPTGKEVNIGSTTDWPMESHKFYFSNEFKQITSRHTQHLDENLLDLDFDYENINYTSFSKPWFGEFYELCRHLNTAKALMNHKPNEIYNSPKPDYECLKSKSWDEQTVLLNSYIEQINNNMKNPAFAKEMYKIMAVASRDEALSFSLF
jgi:hypothetical protein